jgi:tetratricopeptide (TPR) repeat protein
MADNTTPTPGLNPRVLQIAVLALGMAVLLGVFFADKTLLTNQVQVSMNATPNAAKQDGISPLAADPQTDSLLSLLGAATANEEKARILQDIVLNLQARKRPDHAAAYAGQLVELQRSLPHLVQAGKIAYEASQWDYVAADTTLSREFARTSIGWLEAARDQDPRQEETLLYLGLAYIASGMQENSMKGILAIREVLQINPDNPEAGYHLGVFSNTTGQFDKAVQRLEKVVSIQPDFYRARLALAEAYAGLGKPSEAAEELKKVVDQSKDPDLIEAARNMLNQLSSVSP